MNGLLPLEISRDRPSYADVTARCNESVRRRTLPLRARRCCFPCEAQCRLGREARLLAAAGPASGAGSNRRPRPPCDLTGLNPLLGLVRVVRLGAELELAESRRTVRRYIEEPVARATHLPSGLSIRARVTT